MPDVKISAGADPGTLVATDKVPLARSASTTAYAATIAELATYANGAYTPSYFGGSPSMDGTAAPGTSALVGRGDHVHPTDTSRYAASNPSGYQTAAQVATAVAPYANDVGRNLIHNPLMNVAQRGNGPFTTTAQVGLDRWSINLNLDTVSVTRVALSDANRASIGDESAMWSYYNSFTGNAGAASYNYAGHRIEGVHRLSGKTVTVSFWATSGTGLKLGVSIDQSFGTGGSPSAYVSGNGQSVTLSATPARYSVTVAIPSASGKTFGTNGDDYTQLDLWFSCGTTYAALSGSVGVQSGITWLWGVQLEVGSVATPLEKIDPRMDLANCQRFYQVGTVVFAGYGGASATFGFTTLLPVTMRATPTTVFTPLGNLNIGTVTAGGLGSPAGLYFQGLATTVGITQIYGSFTASADL